MILISKSKAAGQQIGKEIQVAFVTWYFVQETRDKWPGNKNLLFYSTLYPLAEG